tara:strand:+ start:447 stop:1328 length:882 start_codon:yes stop_codon:yes gene_type:complete
MKNITFLMPKVDLELACDLLLSFGAYSTTIKNLEEEISFRRMWIDEPGEKRWEAWEKPTITITVGLETSGEFLANKLVKYFNLPSTPNYYEKNIKNLDWVLETQKENIPNKISEKLWILPVGSSRIDRNAANVFLNPGSAFGTGTHPTTKLCLKWLSDNTQGGELVLDFGCGSGILSIASIKLGCLSATAVDIDHHALRVTKENSLINGLSIKTYLPDNLPNKKFDIIISNILAKPLIELLPKFQSLLKPGGSLVISGILESQIESLKHYYSKYFSFVDSKVEKEWGLISGYK